jgi:uncharacterized protein (DUF433 family)
VKVGGDDDRHQAERYCSGPGSSQRTASFRGTRVPFQALLEGGETLDEFLRQFPGVSRQSAIAALQEAKALMLARFEK